MNLTEILDARGGVAPIAALRRLGVTEHALRRAREAGAIVSVRRGWVARVGADPMLVAAARRGVQLTCITLAARRGLWVYEHDEPHVAAHPKSGRARVERGVIHRNLPVFPRDRESCEDVIENALIQVARCQPYEQAIVVWESALKKRAVDPQILARAPLPPAAREMLRDARPFADAGTETIFLTRLRWLDVPILPQAWILGHRVDFLLGERLVVQIDGGHHVGAQRTRDIEHDALLKLHGYHVIRVSYAQLMDDWPRLQAMVMAAIAQRLHRAG